MEDLKRKSVFYVETDLLISDYNADLDDSSNLKNALVNLSRVQNLNDQDEEVADLLNIILNAPESIDYLEKFLCEFLIFTRQNNQDLIDILLNSNFYSNFQKIVEINKEKDCQKVSSECVDLIETSICEVLEIQQIRNLNISTLKSSNNLNLMENVLKYVLDFQVIDVMDLIFSNNIRISLTETSIFLKLVTCITSNTNFQVFGTIFESFLEEKKMCWKDQNQLNTVLIVDLNILLELAYKKKYKSAIERIVQCSEIDINQLKIRSKNKFLSHIAAENGYFELLHVFFIDRNRKTFKLTTDASDKKPLSIFTECLVGRNHSKPEVLFNENFFVIDFDSCIDLIINDPEFSTVLQKYNPMRDAVRNSDTLAVLKLFKKFGLKSELVEGLNKYYLKILLDSCVSINQFTQIEINYEFLKETEGFNALVPLISNEELNDSITHPVISTLINVKSRRFFALYLTNMISFVIIYIGSILWGYYNENASMFLIATVYLCIRECLKLYCYFENFKSSKTKIMLKSIIKSVFSVESNVLEIILLLTTISCWISMGFELFSTYRLFLATTVLLTAIELMLLLTAVVSSLAIYMFMLQTVMETFLRTSIVLVLYVLAFGFCFHVVFYQPRENSDQFNNFGDWFTTFLKMTVMFGGEYEASDLQLDNYTSKLLLFVFVLTAILLYNFINALAIADVQKLRQRAEFLDLKFKTLTIQRQNKLLESFLKNKSYNVFTFIIQTFVAETFEVTKQTINDDREIEFFTKNHRKVNRFQISVDSYNKLKDILKGKEMCELQQYMEKRFDSLAYEIAQLKENLHDMDGIKKEMREMKSLVLNFMTEFRSTQLSIAPLTGQFDTVIGSVGDWAIYK